MPGSALADILLPSAPVRPAGSLGGMTVDLRRPIAFMAALSLVATLAACSAAATPTPQSAAEQATCQALQTWSDDMRTLASMDPTTVGATQLAAQVQKVQDAWSAVEASLKDVSAADKAAVEAGWTTLKAALGAFDASKPVADQVAAIKTAAEPLKTAYKEMGNGFGCVFVTPY